MGDYSPSDRDVARALYDALAANDADAFMGPFDENEAVVIDGRFRLIDLARKLREILAGAP